MDILSFSLGVIVTLIHYYVQTHPKLSWRCIFGRHTYQYSGKRSGMTWSEKRSISGTTRNFYVCKCGRSKPPEKEDYI